MKKLYNNPEALISVISSSDVITQSDLGYSTQENAEINELDIHSFDSFFN